MLTVDRGGQSGVSCRALGLWSGESEKGGAVRRNPSRLVSAAQEQKQRRPRPIRYALGVLSRGKSSCGKSNACNEESFNVVSNR